MPQNFSFCNVTNTSIVANWISEHDECAVGFLVILTVAGNIVSWSNITEEHFTINTLPSQHLAEYGISIAPIGLDGANVSSTTGPYYITFNSKCSSLYGLND